jgi:hypothetical protein
LSWQKASKPVPPELLPPEEVPEPPVLDGVVGVAVPPLLDGVTGAAGVTPPEGVDGAAAVPPEEEGTTDVVDVVVVEVVETDAVVASGVPPLGGAVRTGVVAGTW